MVCLLHKRFILLNTRFISLVAGETHDLILGSETGQIGKPVNSRSYLISFSSCMVIFQCFFAQKPEDHEVRRLHVKLYR